jgi:hypothetical protein
VETGGAITFDMGNVARANLLLIVAREALKEPQTADMAEYVVKLFNRNRENRNFLSHCRIMHVGNAEPGDGRFRVKMYLIGLTELRSVADEFKAMLSFFVAVVDAPQWPASLDRPHLPRTLPERLLSFDPSALLRPESSRE